MFDVRKIAYLGGPGTYSYNACMTKFPNCSHVALDSFAAIFRAVEIGECELAVVPLENSIMGRVSDVHKMLPGSGLYIVGELFIPIRHCLLGLPGATLDGVEEIYSHPQALGQCSNYLAETRFKLRTASDTGSAAALVSKQQCMSIAAIAGRAAAELHQLKILAENIEDSPNNITRFVVLSRETNLGTVSFSSPMTTVTLNLGGNPTQLHRALGGFAKNAINITRVESYLSPETFASSSFIIDFEGSTEDERVQQTLSELSTVVQGVRLLGTYERVNHAGFAGGVNF